MQLRVILHSNTPAAADATDETIKALPGAGAHLVRGEDGHVFIDAQGLATVETSNPGFVRFALVRQRYVADVLNKSVIVYGPKGCGKTTNAKRIATALGLAEIVDDGQFNPRKPPAEGGTLILMLENPAHVHEWKLRYPELTGSLLRTC